MTNCPALNADGSCEVITLIAGLKAVPHPVTCQECGQVTTAHATTICAAMRARREAGQPTADIRQRYAPILQEIGPTDRLQAIVRGEGVGSQLWRLLASLGIEHKPTCSCLDLAEEMNRLGVEGCRREHKRLAQQMRVNAAQYGWGDVVQAAKRAMLSGLIWQINLTDLYGGLLEFAVHRAELVQPDLIDILLVLGPGSRHEDIETRMALRSIERYASGYRRVVIVGAVPGWLRETERVRLVWRNEYRHNKASRISRKVWWAFENLDVTSTVAFWNDDYLLLNPVDVRTIPAHFRGRLQRRENGGWSRLLNGTAEALAAAGLPTRHYDIHVPILLERSKYLSLTTWWQRSQTHPRGLVMKSVYGNHFCEQVCVSTMDRKVQSNWERGLEKLNPKRWIISYGDGALKTGLIDWMHRNYPQPSPAEKPRR